MIFKPAKHLMGLCLFAATALVVPPVQGLAGSPFLPFTTITWLANTESDLAGYKVYRALRSCSTRPVLSPLATLGKVTRYQDHAIPIGTRDVCYALTAFDFSGNESGQSNTAGNTTPLRQPPSAPNTFTIR